MPFIDVSNLKKDFVVTKRGGTLKSSFKELFRKNTAVLTAVDGISFQIEKGDCVGYIGPNGAGKTTTIRMLAGIIVPTSGMVLVNGMISSKNRIQYVKRVGMMFGSRSQLWPELSPLQSFGLLKSIYEVNDKVFRSNLSYITDILNIGSLLSRPLRELSLGQKMRCELASVFLHSPDIIFLDEPTIGLDMEVKRNIRDMIKRLSQEKEVTILYTSHDLKEIEDVCNRLMIINKGRIIYDGKTLDIKSKYASLRNARIVLHNEEEKANLVAFIDRISNADVNRRVETNTIFLSFVSDRFNLPALIEKVGSCKSVRDIVIEDSNMENIVMDLYKGV
jgi:ABC-2 type transport system ATP-binding protein